MRRGALALAAVSAALLVAAHATAQEKTRMKQTPPPPKPAQEIHFPAFEEKTLANGLRVVVIEQHENPSLSLQLLVPGGKVYAPAAKAGLADATAALLREGTQTRSSQQIAETIDAVGGSLDTTASLESGFVSVSVTSDQLDLGLDLLSDVVLRPSFPAEELERWRNQTLSGLQIQQSDPGYVATAAFQRLVLGDHPYGWPSSGTVASVRGLTRDDLVAFHRRQYVPNEAILAVVGDVKAADAFARVERAFDGWKKGEASSIPAVAVQPQRRIVVIDKPDSVQTEIRVGQVGIAYRDPDHYTVDVLDAVLGASPSSRLYEEVRRKRALSYGASTEFRMPTQPGWFLANTFTKTESTVETLGVVLDVLQALDDKPVPVEELAQRKTYITGAFPLEIETPGGIAAKVLEALKFGYGKEYLESYRERIDAVTAEQIQSFAAKRIQPDRMLIVLAGNAKAFAADLEKRFGKFETIPLAKVDLLQPDLRTKETQ
jgi:zinc protease